MCTVLLPPGVNSIAVNKFIIIYQSCPKQQIHYKPPSSSVGLHVFYPRESKCSKWWNSNFINNWTLSLLLFILFHNCWDLQMCWMYGCALENVFTTSLWNRLLTCVRFSKLVQFQIHPPLNILTVPNWLNFKFHYFLIGPKVKILNTLTPLAPIYVMLFHCRHLCELFHASYWFPVMCKRD